MFQQQRPEVLFPQMVNFNPQLANPFGPQGPQLFFPNQGNQLTPMMFPNGQQEQLGPPQDPNAPEVPQQAQNPFQVQPNSMDTHGYFCLNTQSYRFTCCFSQSCREIINFFKFLLDVSTISIPILWISSVSQTAGRKTF